MKYVFASAFLTRRCSLRCPHCMIWKTHRREIPPKEWAKIVEAYNSAGMHVNLFGGEPLEYWKSFEGFLELTRLLKEADWSVISNSLLLTWDRAKKLAEAGLKNWSVSIDYPKRLALLYSKKDPRVYASWRALEWFKKLGVPDLHAVITLYPENVKYFPEIVRDLIDMEVWIEPTFVMWAKAPWYDSFPASVRAEWKPEHIEYIQKGIKLLKGYKYFHGLTEMFYGEGLNQMINASFRCDRLLVPTIDEDGYMRLCRDIPGKRVRKYHAIEALERIEDFERDWLLDREEYCRGCNWDCVWQVKHGFKRFRHI